MRVPPGTCPICREPAPDGSWLCAECNAMWETNSHFRNVWGGVIPELNGPPPPAGAAHVRLIFEEEKNGGGGGWKGPQ